MVATEPRPKPRPPCKNCGKEIATFEQWFTESCGGTGDGHQLDPEDRDQLPKEETDG